MRTRRLVADLAEQLLDPAPGAARGAFMVRRGARTGVVRAPHGTRAEHTPTASETRPPLQKDRPSASKQAGGASPPALRDTHARTSERGRPRLRVPAELKYGTWAARAGLGQGAWPLAHTATRQDCRQQTCLLASRLASILPVSLACRYPAIEARSQGTGPQCRPGRRAYHTLRTQTGAPCAPARVIDPHVVVLARDWLFHEGLVEALPVHQDVVFELLQCVCACVSACVCASVWSMQSCACSM